MKQAEEVELMLPTLLFESIEQLKQLIKLKTTLRCIQNKNSFTCVYYQRKQSFLQPFNISLDTTDLKTSKKQIVLRNDVKRRSTIKNACSRSCGVTSIKGITFKDNFKRYSSQFDYIVNSNLEIIELQQCFLNVKKQYYKIQFYNKHDTGDLACKFTNKLIKRGFTPQQEALITDYINKHDFKLI
ncbi:Hypothetical_protein [Hexamita inflata]|uniref:Hypothetical_protein n=1 Tax=Hexamita inflata TaxID=28002 RepID=A0AA86UKQ6_9EUKA|nr:Hypothetical protein HINF_LOCUS42677 [Hexamita inflata]